MRPGKNRLEKIVTLEKIEQIASNLRAQGYTIATLNGSFDLVHAGHLYMIDEAAKQADVLIIGLNSDASIAQYKSPDRPIVSLENRLALLSAFEAVDYLTWFDETAPLRFIETVGPDVHVNGQEYGSTCIEAPLLKQMQAKLHLVKRIDGLSTTDLIQKIQSLPS